MVRSVVQSSQWAHPKFYFCWTRGPMMEFKFLSGKRWLNRLLSFFAHKIRRMNISSRQHEHWIQEYTVLHNEQAKSMRCYSMDMISLLNDKGMSCEIVSSHGFPGPSSPTMNQNCASLLNLSKAPFNAPQNSCSYHRHLPRGTQTTRDIVNRYHGGPVIISYWT